MIRQPISTRTHILLGISSICLVVVLYSWLSFRQHQKNPKDTTIPNLSQFVDGWQQILIPDVRDGEAAFRVGDLWPPSSRIWLVHDMGVTYYRLFLGVLVGSLIALAIGMAMGCFAPAEAFFLPPLSLLAKIPPTAMLAVYFVLFGTELKMYVAMIALGIFPTLAQSIYQAAKKDVSQHAIYKAYTLGASHTETIWNVVFRQILPRIIENVRLQIGPAMVFLVAAEWMVGGEGFGYRLKIYSRLQGMNVVYSYLIVLGGTGLLIDWGLSTLRRKLCPWFGE